MQDDVVYDLGSIESVREPRRRRKRSRPLSPRVPNDEAFVAEVATPAEEKSRPPTQPDESLVADVRADGPSRIAPRRTSANATPSPAASAIASSFGLLTVGAGHVLQYRTRTGFTLVACGALSLCAIAGITFTLPNLKQAIPVMGLRPEVALWALGGLCALFAMLHVISAVWSRALGAPARTHPALAGAASLLIPGWGQLIRGDLVRTGLFLTGTWCVVGIWTLGSETVAEMLFTFGLQFPPSMSLLISEPVRWAAPAALWPLAVYDAIVCSGR